MERIVMWYVNICFLQLVFTNVALGLRMRYLKIPYIYPSGHDVVLTCDFDLEGEALYAVKWFHDGEEFYRYSPEEDPKAMFFPVRGIKVDMRRANNTSVVLKDIEVWATGMFRCEVLADAPSFHTVTAEAYMIVGEMKNGGIICHGYSYVLLTSLLVTIFQLK